MYEIILIDQGSCENEVELLRPLEQVSGVEIHYLDKNLGYAGGVNYGVSRSSGDYYVMLNNDAIVKDGWLLEMYKTFISSEDIGGVTSNIIENDQQVIMSTGELKHLHGCSMMISKKAWDVVGELDSVTFYPGYGEELDWSYRARRIGYRLLKSDASIVLHGLSRSSNKNLSASTVAKIRLHHRVKFRFINYGVSDWLSRHVFMEFINAFRKGELVLLVYSYVKVILGLRDVLVQREERKRSVARGVRLRSKDG